MFIINQLCINIFITMSEELNEFVGDLLNQLQNAEEQTKKLAKEKNPIKKEELEDFVIQKSGALVEGSLDMIENVKDYIASTPDYKDVSALAELISATTHAIEALNKVVLSTKKNETTVQIKKMDIDAKRELQETGHQHKLTATREEVFKMLINEIKPIEAEVIEPKQLEN